jgi:hypothetical protein
LTRLIAASDEHERQLLEKFAVLFGHERPNAALGEARDLVGNAGASLQQELAIVKRRRHADLLRGAPESRSTSTFSNGKPRIERKSSARWVWPEISKP